MNMNEKIKTNADRIRAMADDVLPGQMGMEDFMETEDI